MVTAIRVSWEVIFQSGLDSTIENRNRNEVFSVPSGICSAV